MQEQSRYSTLNRGLRSDWCRTNWHMIILIYKSLAVATLRFAAKLHRWTSVSETIRNPPLVKPKLHLKKQNKKIYRKTICNMADGILSPCNVASGSVMTCHWIRPNVSHIGILLLVSISAIIIIAVEMSFCTSLRNFIQIGPHSAETMTSCRFSRWRISPSSILRVQ